MKTILIPIDFSDTSIQALKVGATIAKRISAKLLLTHMVGVESGLSKKPNNFEQAIFYRKFIGDKFETLIEQPFLEGILVEPILQKHLNFFAINKLAKDVEASLIVMGSTGAKGMAELLKGSNTEKVVRTAQIPVLVIKENGINFNPECILYASDFDLETVSAYQRIMDIAKMLGSRIEFLYVNLPGQNFNSTKEMDEKLLKFFEAVKHTSPIKAIKKVIRVADYTVEDGVINYADLSECDIIAIPTHGRKGLVHLLQGSISEDIANHAVKPVLTVRMST